MLSLEIDAEIITSLSEKTDKGDQTEIKEIHPESLIFYNSVNIAVGKQGSGKTLLFMREILKLDRLKIPHLILYITGDGKITDDTFIYLSQTLTTPYITIAHNEAKEIINGLLYYKNMYNELFNTRKLHKLKQKEILLNALYLKEFPEYTQKNTRLHTILIFDDIAYSKLFKDPYFESLITKNRHNNIITFFGTQKFTGDAISSAIRSQATSICIYNGFSPRELATIYNNSSIKGLDYQELKRLYNSIKNDQCLYANSKSSEVKIIDLSHIRQALNSI